MYKKYLENEKASTLLFWFVFILYMLVYMTKTCFSAAMSSIVHEGIMTKSQTGLISAMFYLVYAPFQIVGGKIADKYNPAKIITIGLLGSGLCNLIIYFNQNYLLMLSVWSFNAIIQFGIWPSVFKIISSQLASAHRKKAVYYMSFSSSFGLFCSYALAIFMSRWQNNFLFSATVSFFLALCVIFLYPLFEKRMVDAPEEVKQEKIESSNEKHSIKSSTLFLKSGLYLMLPIIIFRTAIEQGSKNLAPTMLMESYDKISPAIGNSLSLIIIIAGIIGIVLAQYITKYIKDEIKGHIYTFLAVVPFLLVITFVGRISSWFIVISLGIVALTTSVTHLFVSYMTLAFAKYGKNGEAAGLINSAASIGLVVQTYGLTFVADMWGWIAVSWLWVGVLAISLLLLLIIMPKWKRFKEEEHI